MMIFEQKDSRYVEGVGAAWLWTLLFGAVYFVYKGIWRHAVISLIAGFFTCGLSWFVYPFFAGGIVRRHYLTTGWVEVQPRAEGEDNAHAADRPDSQI